MKLRLKYIENIGWYSQAKISFFGSWKTIGKHTNGYGLYDENHIDYPMMDSNLALERCKLFEQFWINSKKIPKYIEV